MQALFRATGKTAGWGDLPLSWKGLAEEFPQVLLGGRAPGRDSSRLLLDVEQWKSPGFNFYALDGGLDALAETRKGPFSLVLKGPAEELAQAAREVLTRCQRWMDRRNEASRGELFGRVLSRHREAHDLAKPLVRADYNHALDTWQWTLRLEPDASLAVQLAALFHDVERLATEADARIEQHAPEYQDFKDAHAARGAEMAEALLAEAGVGAVARRRTARLIAVHEHPPEPGDPDAAHSADAALLNDADALSFFSLNSAGYLDYFGPEPTRRKVAYTLRRLRPAARRHLAGLRLRPAVAAAIAEELKVPAT